MKKELKWADLKMKWYPQGTPLSKIPPNFSGHTYDSSPHGEALAQSRLSDFRTRSNRDFGVPSIVPHDNWFNCKAVTSASGVWVYGWWDEEPAQNELGEVAP